MGKIKKILVILGHPSLNSLNKKIADYYFNGAKKNYEVKRLYLPELKFDPILHEGYNKIQELEPDLKKAQELILWAEHLVLVYPIWWTSYPAILKGFIDRILISGFAFKYHKNGDGKHDKLLAGRTASLIMTTGGKRIWYTLFGRIMNKPMSIGILGFCGIKIKHQKFIGSIRKISEDRYKKIISEAKFWGEKGI